MSSCGWPMPARRGTDTHIELVDLLRCPRVHAESWLVATAERMVGRDIVEGQLGCPVCEAVYPITGGAVLFTPATVPEPRAAGEDVLRTAALLNLAEPGGVVVLVGAWSVYARPLATVVDAHVLVIDPLDRVDGVSAIYAGGAIPLAAGSVRAAATDAPEAVVPVLRPGGRVLAPATVGVPPGAAPAPGSNVPGLPVPLGASLPQAASRVADVRTPTTSPNDAGFTSPNAPAAQKDHEKRRDLAASDAGQAPLDLAAPFRCVRAAVVVARSPVVNSTDHEFKTPLVFVTVS